MADKEGYAVADRIVVKAQSELDLFVPLWSFCLVEPLAKNTTKGGIVLPDGSKMDDVGRCKVIKTGPGEHRTCDGVWVENPIKSGDIIYNLARGTVAKVVLEGKLYLMVAGCDVLARQERVEEYL